MHDADYDTISGFVCWLVSTHKHYFGSVKRLISDIAAREKAHHLAGEGGLRRYTCATCGHGFTIVIESEDQGIVSGMCRITADPDLLHRCTRIRPSPRPLTVEALSRPDAWSARERAVDPRVPLWMVRGYGSPEAMAAHDGANTNDAPEQGITRGTGEAYDYDSIDDFVADLEESAEHSMSVVGPLSADILRRQEADPDAMEAGQRYCCHDCGWGFTVFGAGDDLGYQVGASGACRIVVDEALIAPCAPVDRPTIDVMVRHLTEDNPRPEGLIITFPTDRWQDGQSID